MKGVILAGGLATRLYPLTFATNKHLLPVYDKPMIHYPIQTLIKAGIDEILIVVSGPHSGHFINVLRTGKDFGAKHLEYAYQENPKGGIADALALAEDFADGKPIAVILGDNTTDADIKKATRKFNSGATIFLREVTDPQRFGVPRFYEHDERLTSHSSIAEIIEKPQKPPSNYAVTGLYLYDSSVFDKIRKLKPSDRNELEITDVNNAYLKDGKLNWEELNGYWLDCGTFDTLFQANLYWSQKGKH